MNDLRQVCFIEMMGEPGSYDATVYDHLENKDQEGQWFVRRFSGINITTCNVCLGEELPHPENIDGIVLAGSYNSVYDNTGWQQQVRKWLPLLRRYNTPTLAVCGAHQLMAHVYGARVEALTNGP